MTIPERLRALGREPLVHFCVIGLLLFVVMGSGDGEIDPESRTIAVTQTEIDGLAAEWEQTWQRQPTEDELDELIDEFIREEIYYREAIRLGLDEDDTVIRRRLRSKMEFLARAQVESAAPDDSVLQEWLDRYPGRYESGATLSFDQVYLADGDNSAQILERLRNGANHEGLGSPISLSPSMEAADRTIIARQFGQEFANRLIELPAGNWQGPISSGFGRHLVRVRVRNEGETPSLATVRQRVENDWRSATQDERETAAFDILREAYTVTIERQE